MASTPVADKPTIDPTDAAERLRAWRALRARVERARREAGQPVRPRAAAASDEVEGRDGPGAWSVAPRWGAPILAAIAIGIELVIRALVFFGKIWGVIPRNEVNPRRYNVTRLREESANRRPVRLAPGERRPVVHLVVNPISGEGKSMRILPALRRGLRERGFAVDAVITTCAGEACRRIPEELLRDENDPVRVERGFGPPHAVIAVGGDGTLGEVVAGVRAADDALVARGEEPTRARIALYAAGTVNCLSTDFDLPSKIDEFCDMVAFGRTVDFDLGEVECLADPEDDEPQAPRYFHSFMGVGWDAKVIEEMHRRRSGNIWHAAYTVPIYESLRKYAFPPLHVSVDDRTLARAGGMAVISNIKSYAHMDVSPAASPLDGVFDVGVVRRRSVLGMVRAIWHAARRDERKLHHEVVHDRGVEVEVTSTAHRVPIQADGDHVGFLPARVRLIPGAIRLVIPAGPVASLPGPTPPAIARPAKTAEIIKLPGAAASDDAGRRAARVADPGLGQSGLAPDPARG